MQTFKQIPYQNYIQLKFNTRNLNEAQRQQALIKYKRNSQLLAEIFTFKNPTQQPLINQAQTKSDEHINQALLSRQKSQIIAEQTKANQLLQTIKQSSMFYQDTLKAVNEAKSKEQLLMKIQQVKEKGLQDERHPFFCSGSPFMMFTGDEEILQVKCIEEENEQEGLDLLQLV